MHVCVYVCVIAASKPAPTAVVPHDDAADDHAGFAYVTSARAATAAAGI